jgi:glycosyltransferase involved in cell wall biosynthesis
MAGISDITLVIPSRNNLKYTKMAYESIRRHLGPFQRIVILDDASTDGTDFWLATTFMKDICLKAYRNNGPDRVGHTVLYDKGAELADTPLFGIFHADMIASPNYLQNMVKHWKPGTVVAGTRIEPPLHPPGPEKHVVNLGMEPEEFKEDAFLKLVSELEAQNKDRTTQGIFAPWVVSKEDFFKIGGHDKKVFAPMELEDSDLFNRFRLAGYNLVQSRDAFVYHMTCRGSRYKDGIKIVQQIPVGGGNIWNRAQDSEEYTKLRQNKFREWWRKWHSDVLHDPNMMPVVNPRYNVGFVVMNCTAQHAYHLEPWCDTLYMDATEGSKYSAQEQSQTVFDLRQRVKDINTEKVNDVVIEFDANNLRPEHMNFIKQIPLMLTDSGEEGIMEFDIFRFIINKLDRKEKLLTNNENFYKLCPLYESSTQISK